MGEYIASVPKKRSISLLKTQTIGHIKEKGLAIQQTRNCTKTETYRLRNVLLKQECMILQEDK